MYLKANNVTVSSLSIPDGIQPMSSNLFQVGNGRALYTGSLSDIALFSRFTTDEEDAALFRASPMRKYTAADWMLDQNNPDNVRTPRYLGATSTPTNSNIVVINIRPNFTRTVQAHRGDWVAFLGTDQPPLWIRGMCLRWNGFSWEQIPLDASGSFESGPYAAALMDLTAGAPMGMFVSVLVRNLVANTALINELQASIITLSGGGVLQSENFLTGVRGARILANGNAELYNAVFRGELQAQHIRITGAVTAGNNFLLKRTNIPAVISWGGIRSSVIGSFTVMATGSVRAIFSFRDAGGWFGGTFRLTVNGAQISTGSVDSPPPFVNIQLNQSINIIELWGEAGQGGGTFGGSTFGMGQFELRTQNDPGILGALG